MVIGITKNSKIGKDKLSKYFNEKSQDFKYFDVDAYLEKLLEKKYYNNELKNNNWKDNTSLLLEIKNNIDNEINRFIESFSNDGIVVIDYSILEDSTMFDACNIVIKSHPDLISDSDEVTLLKSHRIRSLLSLSVHNDFRYHLELDMEADWKNKLDDFIDYNIYGNKKVTVVIPIYNTVEYLSQCVNSVKSQSYRNLEILLIDDGSTDDSLKLCQLIAQTDPRIKVIHQNNVGLAETRNRGIELATGEYICFFDSDDYIENSMIETLLKTIEKTGTDVCESSFYIHMKNGVVKDVSGEQKGIKYVGGQLDLINAYSDATILIPAWDKIYKLSSIKNIKFDKKCFKEDSDYIYKLCMAGKTFALVNTPFYHYIKRKSTSLTGNKISPKLFTLSDWGKEKYDEVLSQGEEYRDAAEKILYNSLVHILRNFMRDYKNNEIKENEYVVEIQNVCNDIINLLLTAKDVKKFRKLEEVLSIINELIQNGILDKEKMPSIEIPCIGILWNSLNKEMMEEAVKMIKERATITDCIAVDLEETYRQFINEIYLYNDEVEGITAIKSGTLIDKYDSNTILILNLIVRVSNYMYFNKNKGFMFKEIAQLKSLIRKFFKTKITDYAFDNIFHLTVDNEEYEYTDEICKKFVRKYENPNEK